MTPAEAARLLPGDRVVYCPRDRGDGGGREEGTVVRVGWQWVFVCYGSPGSTPAATDPRDLERVVCPLPATGGTEEANR